MLRAFKGVMYAANTCQTYLLRDELDYPPFMKPQTMVLVVFLELCLSILFWGW